MSHQHPPIDLDGFQRLSDLERRIWYSPVSIMVYLIGLSGAVYEIWNFQTCQHRSRDNPLSQFQVMVSRRL